MRATALLLTALLAVGTAQARSDGTQTYDLIFKTGTLSDLETRDQLEYSRELTVPADTSYAEVNSGSVNLVMEPENVARLEFEHDGKPQNIGNFPADVGNPVIMYFIETVLRDMALQSGGSPFYIRNRIKESLVEEAPIEQVSVDYNDAKVAARDITLRPFIDDKNRDRMRGFQNIELSFTVSDDIPGWYHSLVATVANPAGGDPIYSNTLMLQSSGDPQ